jgi:acetylornithine deacetylase
MQYSIDRDYIIQTLMELVRINSVNPLLSADGKGEAELGAYVANALGELGLTVNTYEIQPGRVNVVGILKGTGNEGVHGWRRGIGGRLVDNSGRR